MELGNFGSGSSSGAQKIPLGFQNTFFEACTGMLQAGFALSFRATGGSMYPTIREGETICVAPVNPTEVRRGDIVLYKTREKILVHRVDALEGTQLRFRGDALEDLDEPAAANQIYGRAVWVEREGRKIRLDNYRARLRWRARACIAFCVRWIRHRPKSRPALLDNFNIVL